MELNFEDLKVGEQFFFPAKSNKLYTKIEEKRRPYTPEAYSNASFDWRNVDPRTNTLISEGTTVFYVTPTSKVIPVMGQGRVMYWRTSSGKLSILSLAGSLAG